ncbi:MAG: hypothetical protein AAF957_13615 [Planctomycetota bacterium]
MKIEPSDEEDLDDFVVVDDGDYRMRVGSVSEDRSPERGVSWMLRLELVGGDRAGRTAVTDWLNFTARGMHRVRIVLAALGFDVSETLEVEPDQLVGREAIVRLRTQETVREPDGRLQRRSKVTYDGWSPLADAEAAGAAEGTVSGAGAGAGGNASGVFAADEMPF